MNGFIFSTLTFGAIAGVFLAGINFGVRRLKKMSSDKYSEIEFEVNENKKKIEEINMEIREELMKRNREITRIEALYLRVKQLTLKPSEIPLPNSAQAVERDAIVTLLDAYKFELEHSNITFSIFRECCVRMDNYNKILTSRSANNLGKMCTIIEMEKHKNIAIAALGLIVGLLFGFAIGVD